MVVYYCHCFKKNVTSDYKANWYKLNGKNKNCLLVPALIVCVHIYIHKVHSFCF